MRAPGETANELPAEAGFRQVQVHRDKAYSAGKLIGGVTGPVPVTIRNYTSATAKRELAELLTQWKPDVVQIEGVHLVEYIPTIRRHASKAAVVADWHNVESELMWRYSEATESLPRRLMAKRTASLIEAAENKLLKQCDAHSVVSAREREKLLKRWGQAQVGVVPNGVDVDYYQAGPDRVAGAARELLFVGSMDYHANIDAMVWFVRQVWPSIQAQHPGLTVRIVGREPSAEVRALEAQDVLVTGTVDDVRPYYSKALAVIVPLRVGGGTRLKILESMAAGIPVISTSLGAEGLSVTDGVHLLLADTIESWAQRIAGLLASPDQADRLIAEGKKLVRESYDWPVAVRALEELHRACVST